MITVNVSGPAAFSFAGGFYDWYLNYQILVVSIRLSNDQGDSWTGTCSAYNYQVACNVTHATLFRFGSYLYASASGEPNPSAAIFGNPRPILFVLPAFVAAAKDVIVSPYSYSYVYVCFEAVFGSRCVRTVNWRHSMSNGHFVTGYLPM
jgi:hypothetical protein